MKFRNKIYPAFLFPFSIYHYQGSNITMHHSTFTISKPHSILMNLIDFIKKTGLPLKIPNITALSSISFTTILTNIFAKQKSFLFSYFVNLDKKKKKKLVNLDKKKKKLQNGITEGENLQGQKLPKLLIAKKTTRLLAIVIDSWKHYHDSTFIAVTIVMHQYIITPLVTIDNFLWIPVVLLTSPFLKGPTLKGNNLLLMGAFQKGGKTSHTCIKQAPKGKPKSGCLRQMLA